MSRPEVFRYEVTLPDGLTQWRDSRRAYTHAVVQRGERAWWVVAFCESAKTAEKKRVIHRRLWPGDPCEVLPTRRTTPLTDRQRAFLLDLGEGAREMFGPPPRALVDRRLVAMQHIGMRWWRVRRTAAGRDAVGAPAPATVAVAPVIETASGPAMPILVDIDALRGALAANDESSRDARGDRE